MKIVEKAVLRFVGYGPVDRLLAVTNIPEDMLTSFTPARPEGYPKAIQRGLPDVKFVTRPQSIRGPDGKLEYTAKTEEVVPGFLNVEMTVRAHQESAARIDAYIQRNAKGERPIVTLAEMAIPVASDLKGSFNISEMEDIPVVETNAVVGASEENAPAPVAKTKAGETHVCNTKGRYGKYAPIGTCPGCDLLRAKKLAGATV